MATKETERKQPSRRPRAAAASGAKRQTDAPKKASASRGAAARTGRTVTAQTAQKRTSAGGSGEKKRRGAPVRDRRSANTPAARSAKRTSRRTRQPKKTAERVTPEVVYLPPKPFSRNRLILRLATVAAVVAALVLGISIFFKVEHVVVYGANKYSAYDIKEASGIKEGDNLLTFSRAQASGKIIGTLPYVQSVSFGIKLPDTVNIEIVESAVSYSVEDQSGSWWLISAEGKVLESIAVGGQMGHTQLLGFRLDNPAVGSQAAALEDGEVQTDPEGTTVPAAVTQRKRLQTALNIAQYLESNGIIGQAASVDVTDLGAIRIQYGQKYSVELGDDSQLGYKISCLKNLVAKLETESPHATGRLNLSNPDRIVFDPDE